MSLLRRISIWEFFLSCGNELEAEFQLCQTYRMKHQYRKLSCNFQWNKRGEGYECFWNYKHMLLCSHIPENNYSPAKRNLIAGLSRKMMATCHLSSVKDKLQNFLWNHLITKCSMWWDSIYHILKRWPWTKESLIPYSAYKS